MRRKAALLVCAISFACTVWIPLAVHSRSGDLAGWYTDHLHNTYATWVFLHKGLAVYTQPFAQASKHVPAYPQEDHGWGIMPIAYPPGVFLLFAPLTAIGKFFPMSRADFGIVGVIYMLFLAHCAWFAALRALDASVGRLRWLVALAFWHEIVFTGLQGFFDVAYIGFGALAVGAFARRDPARSLLWVCVASLFHYRAICLVGLGLLALYEATRDVSPKQWPWRTLLFALVTGVVVIASFLLIYQTASLSREAARPQLLRGDVRPIAIGIAILAATIGGYLGGRGVVALTFGCLALALVEKQPYWWHSACLVLLPLSVGISTRARAPAFARLAFVVFAAFVARRIWKAEYLSLPRDLNKHFHFVQRAEALVEGIPFVAPAPRTPSQTPSTSSPPTSRQTPAAR